MTLVFALPGALAYGIGDFAGGLAARRGPVLVVTAAVQLVGLLALAPFVPLMGGAPTTGALALGGLSGVAGAAGLLLYLRALAMGPMGVVAPLSAVVGAGLPLVVGVLGGEPLGPVTLVGIAVALAAIVLATAGGSAGTGARTGTLFALGAGVGFAAFFVLLARAPADSGLWPVLAGRLAAVPLLTLSALLARSRLTGPFPVRLVLLSGVGDTLANVLYLLATRTGALGVSAVVVSLYPGVVAVLAAIVLRERLTRWQLGGAGLALGASVLLAVGG